MTRNGAPEPARNIAWHITAAELQLVRSDDGTHVGLVIDTPDLRTISWWTPVQLERLARQMLAYIGVAPDGLVIESLPRLGDLPRRDEP